MSRHFEILKKADRTGELFGPPADTESSGAVFESDSEPFLPSRVGRSPANVDTRSLEAWRQLVRYLFPFQNSRACRSIGICGVEKGQSVATVVANLGEYLNRFANSRLLLVEANCRRPSLARIFGVPAEPGFNEMMLDPNSQGDYIHASSFEHLWVLPAGNAARRRRGADMEQGFRYLYEAVSTQFHRLIVETPAVNDRDSAFPYSLLDGVIVVVRHQWTGKRDLERAMRWLAEANANVVGTILDDPAQKPGTQGNGGLAGTIAPFLNKLRRA